MANGSSRLVSGLVALVIGLALGWFIRARFPPPSPPPSPLAGTQVILVGPKAGDLYTPGGGNAQKAKLSKLNKDVVFWLAKAADKQLLIQFSDPIFSNMTKQANGRWQVDCKGRRCYSDEISPDAAYQEYKYWQILIDSQGNREEADGIIIIDR